MEGIIYAIVETGGKQYKVSPGQVLNVELLPAREGDMIELGQVLMVAEGDDVSIGQPTVPGAKVMAEVLGETKGKKVIVFKYKPKVRYRKKTGHRQGYTQLAIRSIEMSRESTSGTPEE